MLNTEDARMFGSMIGKGHSASDNIAHKHPAIFPEKLAQDHIISWSNSGDLVYDPFLGSGTVALMAELNGRNISVVKLMKITAKLPGKDYEEFLHHRNHRPQNS